MYSVLCFKELIGKCVLAEIIYREIYQRNIITWKNTSNDEFLVNFNPV